MRIIILALTSLGLLVGTSGAALSKTKCMIEDEKFESLGTAPDYDEKAMCELLSRAFADYEIIIVTVANEFIDTDKDIKRFNLIVRALRFPLRTVKDRLRAKGQYVILCAHCSEPQNKWYWGTKSYRGPDKSEGVE